MKAAFFDRVGQPLRIGMAPDPTPAADEAVLRIAVCGICGSDLHITTDPATFGISAGAVLGHEFAGEVVAVGAAAADLRLGDHVAVSPIYGCGHCPRCLAGDPAWCNQMRLDILDAAEKVGIQNRHINVVWPNDDLVITIDTVTAEPNRVHPHNLQFGQEALGAIAMEALLKLPGSEVLFNH